MGKTTSLHLFHSDVVKVALVMVFILEIFLWKSYVEMHLDRLLTLVLNNHVERVSRRMVIPQMKFYCFYTVL